MFTDIENHWSKKCILELAQRNLVSGYPDRTFRPNAPLTRAEFAVLMGNIFNRVPAVQAPISFQDVPKNHWAYKDIQTASAKGFLAGYPDRTFKPEQLIPRVQAFIALAAQLKLKVPENPAELLPQYFDDAASIPQYARNTIAAASTGFLVVSYPNSRQLQPNKSATRGELAASLCQVLEIANVVPPQYLAKNKLYAIAPQFDAALKFQEGCAPANVNQKWGFIDIRGNFIIAPEFVYAEGFAEELAPVMRNDSWGFIDKTGNFVIQPQFYLARPFSEGLAAVILTGDAEAKWGFIDKTGKLAIAPQFDEAGAFSQGLASVRRGDTRGFIDKTGNFVNQSPGEIQPSTPVLKPSAMGEQWGYVDREGKWIVQPQFDEAGEFSEGLAAVRVGGQWVTEGRGNDGSGSPAEYVKVLKGGKVGYILNPLQ